MTTPTTDLAAIRHHLEVLYGTADAGYLAVWQLPTRQTVWADVADLEAAAAAIALAGEAGNVYAGVGLHPAPLGGHARGEAAGVSAIPGLWVEVDIGTDGHADGARPPDLEAARRLVRAVPVLPSYAVHSGGGVHCYWLFREVWHFENEADRAQAARMVRALQWLITRAAREHGWTIDPTADLARVLRPAGTVNRKPGLPPRPVRIISDHPERRYGIEELADRLPLADELFPQGGAPRAAGPSRAPAAHWSRVAAQCGYMRHCVEDAATLSEPEWHAALTVAARCVNGEAIAHAISAPYPGYSPTETAAKHAYAAGRDNPIRCETIYRDRGGGPWCSACPHRGRITSPLQLGYPQGYRFTRPARPGGEGNR